MPEFISSLETDEKTQELATQLKEAVDTREISKKYDQEGREQVASQIIETRTKKSTAEIKIEENKLRISELKEKIWINYDKEKELSESLDTRMKSFLHKAKTFLRISDTSAAQLTERIQSLHTEQVSSGELIDQLEIELKNLEEERRNLPDSKELLDAYKEKIESTPFTNIEKRELLKPEVVSELSMDEYIVLCKRLNPYFVAHVTRQGFRDHFGHMYHTSGLEEYHNGLESILKNDMSIKPKLVLEGMVDREKETIENWISDQKYPNGTTIFDLENIEVAKETFKKMLTHTLGKAPKYADSTSVHFTQQIVGDSMYGGESENEVFFMMPADIMASQYKYYFNGWEDQVDFTKPQSEANWNDVFFWPDQKENARIPINMGIVFLPKSTPVDIETGSKYSSKKTTENGVEIVSMVEDRDLKYKFVAWGIESLLNPGNETYEMYEEFSKNLDNYKLVIQRTTEEIIKLGITRENALEIAKNTLEIIKFDRLGELTPEDLENIVDNSSAKWKRATNTVTSQEYWENYFNKNPDLRPKHIYYYDGDPTSAVYEFQRKFGIGRADTSEKDGKLLGFDDHSIRDLENNASINADFQELLESGYRIIEEKFQQKTTPI